jgi:hypothetical protein
MLVLALSAGMATLWVAGPYIFAGRDDPTAIDSKPVRTTVKAGCTQLRADLAALPAAMAAGDRAEAENLAVEQFVGKVRALGPEALEHDHPVENWLGDWELLVAARREAAREGKRFITPMGDIGPVNVRMFALIRSGLEQCDVPEQLLAPEPGRV